MTPRLVIDDVQQTLLRAPPEGAAGIHRVLVAFDGSEGAWAALRRGIEVAVANRALLTIAAVAEEPVAIWLGFGAMCLPYTREMIRQQAESAMRRQLADARDEVPATVSVTTRLLHARPARVLAALAEDGRYDLVVTGPRPSGRCGRLLRRSVTHGVLSRTRTSVLAVKAA